MRTLFLIICLQFMNIAQAASFDPSTNWPLCGRIATNPPSGWSVYAGCPTLRQGNSAYTDAPISSTYGPRQLYSGDYRYDFHRGIDIPTPIGTPIFAITGGLVMLAGRYASYEDSLVQIRHYRPGKTTCTNAGGCYFSNYMHLSSWLVKAGQNVVKGQLIGYSGASASGFEHLHFEIRNATAADPYSAWQMDAIHPLAVLPYLDHGVTNFTASIDAINMFEPGILQVKTTFSAPMAVELDFNRIEVQLYDPKTNATLNTLTTKYVGKTIDGDGYAVNPHFFDLTLFNRQYSHKNSSAIPFSSFQTGGKYQCPFANAHGSSLDANVHMDHESALSYQNGDFNGIEVIVPFYNSNSATYKMSVNFNQLEYSGDTTNICVRATLVDVMGNSGSVSRCKF